MKAGELVNYVDGSFGSCASTHVFLPSPSYLGKVLAVFLRGGRQRPWGCKLDVLRLLSCVPGLVALVGTPTPSCAAYKARGTLKTS